MDTNVSNFTSFNAAAALVLPVVQPQGVLLALEGNGANANSWPALPDALLRTLANAIATSDTNAGIHSRQLAVDGNATLHVVAAASRGAIGSHVEIDAATFDRIANSAVAVLRAGAASEKLQGEVNSLSEHLSNTYEELSLIYRISSGMSLTRKPAEFLRTAFDDILGVLPAKAIGCYLADVNGSPLSVVSDAASFTGDQELRFGQALLRSIDNQRKPTMLNQLPAGSAYAQIAPAVGRLIASPMLRGDVMVGVLYALDKHDNEDFNTQDLKLLSALSVELTIYVENTRLFADSQNLLMGLLHSLTSAVDAKDAYTCGHSRRVALYARELAMKAGMPDEFCQRVYMAGLLHDVGKIGIREHVLGKTGKLDEIEFQEIKTHVEIGARILKDVKQVADLLPGVLHHHERYDGRGYPHRLSGQNIPLIARLLCLADSFDAMTSNRTYRRALPFEVAMIEIRRCAGTHFDPVLAEAFVRIGVDRLRELSASTNSSSLNLELKAA